MSNGLGGIPNKTTSSSHGSRQVGTLPVSLSLDSVDGISCILTSLLLCPWTLVYNASGHTLELQNFVAITFLVAVGIVLKNIYGHVILAMKVLKLLVKKHAYMGGD